jgi:acetyl esterase/lipase
MTLDHKTIVSLLTLAGMSWSDLAFALDEKPVPRPNAKGNAPAFEVEKHKDIAYRSDKDADPERHKLDVYVPKGQKDFPVVLFVHGGGWRWGSKSLYAGIGEEFAKAGIGFVICNYRLTPQVQHPGHIEDVARAFAWTCENMGKYGGKTDNLFVCGHSAGGHLVSLLATDPDYLKAVKHAPSDIKGVISVSGVYTIYPNEVVFQGAFGKNAEVCKKASPLNHVTGKHPPFLIAYAEKDYPHLDEMARDMFAALKKADSPAEIMLCKGRNHINIITSFIQPDDALNQAFLAFLKEKCK